MKLHKFLIFTSALSVILFIGYSVVKSTTPTQGFASYYTFSRMLIEGEDLNSSYDTIHFNQKIIGYGVAGVSEVPNPLPTNSLMMLPVAWLSPVPAKILWTVFSVIFIMVSVVLLLKSFDIKPGSNLGLMLITVTFVFYPLYYQIALGQAYALLLMLFSISIYGFKKENLWLAAIPLSLVLLLKGYGVIPLVFLAVFKKWKELFAVLGFSALIMLVTLPLLHIEAWQVFFEKVFLQFGTGAYESNTAFQTINSLVKHTFMSDALLPHSILKLSPAVTGYIVLVLGILLCISVVYKSSRENFTVLYAASISLNVILAPVAEDYHFVLLLPLVFITCKMIYENYKGMKIELIFFVISVILLAVKINFRSLDGTEFPVYHLAYPRLYGALMLIVIFKIMLQKKKQIVEVVKPVI